MKKVEAKLGNIKYTAEQTGVNIVKITRFNDKTTEFFVSLELFENFAKEWAKEKMFSKLFG